MSPSRLLAKGLWAPAMALAMASHAHAEGAKRSATGPPLASEPPALSRLYAAYDAAFRETLEKPSNPGTLATFARIAVEIGDLEGAISALERLLLLTGDLPDVKLELGVLYFRLGSFETARAYLRSAIASPNATAYVKDRASRYLRAKTKS